MRVMRRVPFQSKLLLSLILVVVLTTVLGYYLINMSTGRAFTDFASTSFRGQRVILQKVLSEYYLKMGDWRGVDRLFRQDRALLAYVLADENGEVVSAPTPERLGTKLSSSEMQAGTPIEVEGETVGTILPASVLRWINPVEQRFLSSVSLGLWITAGVVSGVGIVISVLLARQLTVPLKRLGLAAQRISQGELSDRVPVASEDELGHLARSFNEMVESLEESEQARRQMIADISHELRSPISVIRTALEGMRDGLLEPDAENFASLHNKILLTTRLVEDLQKLALADAGELSILREVCRLDELLGNVCATVGVEIEDQGIDLKLELSEAPLVNVDRQRIEQVVLNLLHNAMRYTPLGGKIEVSLGSAIEGWARVSVCDTGPGVPEEDKENIFDRFYRSDRSRARETGGAGLGLSIAKVLVEVHGGRIWVANREEGGACFIFTLPAAEGKATRS